MDILLPIFKDNCDLCFKRREKTTTNALSYGPLFGILQVYEVGVVNSDKTSHLSLMLSYALAFYRATCMHAIGHTGT